MNEHFDNFKMPWKYKLKFNIYKLHQQQSNVLLKLREIQKDNMLVVFSSLTWLSLFFDQKDRIAGILDTRICTRVILVAFNVTSLTNRFLCLILWGFPAMGVSIQ